MGERGLLRSLRPYFTPAGRRLLLGAREADDAAVWRGDAIEVATTDTMVEGIDFRTDWPGFDFVLLGRRLLAINLSDLAGMGAEPRHALISLSLKRQTKAADVKRLYQGIAEQARRFGVTVAGGDLSATSGPLTVSASLIGRVSSARRLLRRTGARPGWQIAVTGSLGAAAKGLRLLEAGRRPATAVERIWVAAQLDPSPQVAAGKALAAAGITVGGDISDGLYRELERLVEPSRMGATIALDRLPLARGLRPAEWPLALRDSEDFELICAAPLARMAAAQAALRRIGLSLTIMGRLDRQRGIRLSDRGRVKALKGAGYDHFR
jgi:thiamine-monophosphate kinase